MANRREEHDRDERVSMRGADPEEVLRALLQVDPESSPVADDAPDREQDDTPTE